MTHIVVRDIQEDEISIYTPDGKCLVVTRNMLCVNDVLLQIRKQNLEGYYVEAKGIRYNITKHGRIKGPIDSIYANQLKELMGF